MNTQSTTKTWLWMGGVLVVIIGAYYMWGSSLSFSSSSDTLQGSGQSATGVAGAQVLTLLNQVKDLRIDKTLFTDQAYLSLHDFSVTIPQQNVGRANPFAPIPGLPTQPKK